jgi:ABC-type polysaccharide transport system permease subunit
MEVILFLFCVKIQVGSFETFKQRPEYFCFVYIKHNIWKKVGLKVESFAIQLFDSLEVMMHSQLLKRLKCESK